MDLGNLGETLGSVLNGGVGEMIQNATDGKDTGSLVQEIASKVVGEAGDLTTLSDAQINEIIQKVMLKLNISGVDQGEIVAKVKVALESFKRALNK
ncbi:MAG: hypothetical protein IJ215_05975 [Clostridia bacterium]|nr:hypothetical protein [Clostridia bacterium]